MSDPVQDLAKYKEYTEKNRAVIINKIQENPAEALSGLVQVAVLAASYLATMQDPDVGDDIRVSADMALSASVHFLLG